MNETAFARYSTSCRIALDDGLIRIKDQERNYEKKLLNKTLINQAKASIFLNQKVRLKPSQAIVAKFMMRSLNENSNDRQMSLVPKSKQVRAQLFWEEASHSLRADCV